MLAQVFGNGYNLVKVTKAVMEEDEDVEVNGDTGQTEDDIWDWIATKQHTITFDKGEMV